MAFSGQYGPPAPRPYGPPAPTFAGPVKSISKPLTPINQMLTGRIQPGFKAVPPRTTPIAQGIAQYTNSVINNPQFKPAPKKPTLAQQVFPDKGNILQRGANAIGRGALGFLEPVGERVGSGIRSIETRSWDPLKESFQAQKERMFIQPGDDLETQIRKATDLALIANVDAGFRPVKKGTNYKPLDAKYEKNPLGYKAPKVDTTYKDLDPKYTASIKPPIYVNKYSKVDPEIQRYLDELKAKQANAKKTETGGLFDPVKNFYSNIKKKSVDFNAPIEDALTKAERQGKFNILPTKDIRLQIDRVLRSQNIAGQFMKDNGLVDVIRKADDLADLDQYLIAKHGIDVSKRGIKTGRDVVKDQKLVDALAPQYDEVATQVVQYSRRLKDYMVDTGLISKDLSAKLDEMYPNYVPLERIMDEADNAFQGGTNAVASLSKQTGVRKLQGSELEVKSPLESLVNKTREVIEQGEKNKAAQMLSSYRDLPGNPFGITPLRTAENVKQRMSLYGEAKELKPLQNKIDSVIKTRSSSLRKLEAELNRLNKAGVKESTRGTATKAITTVKRYQPKQLIERLIATESSKLALIKKKIGVREPKVAQLIDTINELRTQFDDVKSFRGGLIDEARLLKDAEAKGKSTISTFRDGIKEVYEVNPEIAEAAKAMGVQQLNILGKILAAPVRIARLGITGYNIPFAAANVVRDQIMTLVTSKNPYRTSVANPAVFTKSLFNAVGHGKLYDDLIREGAGGTSYDITRNAVPQTVSRIRAGRSVPSRVWHTVKHPGDLFRMAEDVFARGEELTRLQQFEGTRQALLKQGRTVKDANILAAKAARENTANFARRGEWGAVLNNTWLYLNAGIQGSRTLVRSASRAPIRTTAKIVTTLLMPVAAITAWNLKDEQRKVAYQDIPEYEKEGNLVILPPNPIKTDGRWNAIKIPLPPGLGNITIPVRRAMEEASGLDPIRFGEMASALIGTISPVKPDDSFASTATPQALKPGLELFTNKDFFTGFPIVPKSKAELSPELQVNEDTSGSARKLGEIFNVSPIKVEHFIKGTFGETGSQVLNAADRALAGLDIIPKEQVGGRGIIEGVKRRFLNSAGNNTVNEEKDEMYKKLKDAKDESARKKIEAQAVYEDLKKLPKEEANAKAKALKEVDPVLYRKVKEMAEDAKLGRTEEDKLIYRLGVENGDRAEHIWEKIQKMSTNEEKNAYIEEMKRKKIVTDEVFKQLKELAGDRNEVKAWSTRRPFEKEIYFDPNDPGYKITDWQAEYKDLEVKDTGPRVNSDRRLIQNPAQTLRNILNSIDMDINLTDAQKEAQKKQVIENYMEENGDDEEYSTPVFAS